MTLRTMSSALDKIYRMLRKMSSKLRTDVLAIEENFPNVEDARPES
jgi:Holliday junction resolvasome RuvABC endonuclease subunit